MYKDKRASFAKELTTHVNEKMAQKQNWKAGSQYEPSTSTQRYDRKDKFKSFKQDKNKT